LTDYATPTNRFEVLPYFKVVSKPGSATGATANEAREYGSDERNRHKGKTTRSDEWDRNKVKTPADEWDGYQDETGARGEERRLIAQALFWRTVGARAQKVMDFFPFVMLASCIAGALCSWLPMLYFFAAANVLSTCEKDLGVFLKWMALFPFAMQLCCIPCFRFCGALSIPLSGSYRFFLCSEPLAKVVPVLHTLCFFISAWVFHSATTDDNCYDEDEKHEHASINPRIFLLVMLIFQFFGVCGACLALCVNDDSGDDDGPLFNPSVIGRICDKE